MSFPVYGEGLTPGGSNPNIVNTERQKEINSRGFGVVRDLSHNLTRLQAGGVLIENTTKIVKAGQMRFVSARTDIDGNWHRVSGYRGEKLMRITLVNPHNPQADPEGYAELEFAEPELKNGKTTAIKQSRLRLDVDGQAAIHVSGIEGGLKFNADYPNPQSMYAGLTTAETMLRDAEIGVTDLLQRLPQVDTAAPPAQ
jgi:hypothetical protein